MTKTIRSAAVTLGVLDVYAPDRADPSYECYGLYLSIGAQPVFVDIRQDMRLEQRKLKAMDLFVHSKELEASFERFIADNPAFSTRSVRYIGLHSKNLEQGEVFWDPTGYTLLKDLTFVLE
jgi:hypothetical protein